MLGGPAATLSGVRHVYDGRRGRVEALRDVDLTLRRGELTALLGVNGSGKSTLLRLLAAVQRLTEGRVEVLGQDVASSTADEVRALRSRVAYARQDAALDPEMYVLETLELMATLYGVSGSRRRERVAELVDAFGLEELTARRVDELSGGQQRRLHLASALVHDPELILLDEPAAGLDATGTEALWAELVRRAGAGRAVVLVTHELDAAERHANRVVLLESGRVVADGAPTALASDLAPEPEDASLGEAFRRLTGHDPEELVPAQPRRPSGPRNAGRRKVGGR